MSRSAVAEVTGKMPFAGKNIMKNLFQRGREASRNGDYSGKLGAAGALGGFAAFHAIQLIMGISELTRDDNTNPALVSIDALFTTANAMATYTQAYLGTKVLLTRQEVPAGVAVTSDGFTTTDFSPNQEQPEIKLGAETPTDLAITLGGQALFLATYQW